MSEGFSESTRPHRPETGQGHGFELFGREHSVSLLELMANSASDPVFIKDRQLRYRYLNPAFERLFAKPAAELLGCRDTQLFNKEEAAAIQSIDRRVLDGETNTSEHTLLVRGVAHLFHTVKSPLRDAGGNIIGVCGIARDLTKIRAAETALRESQEENQALLAAIPDMILHVTRDGDYLACKYPRDFEPWKVEIEREVVGQNVAASVPAEIADRAKEAVRNAVDTGQTQHLRYAIEVQGEVRNREARVVSFRNDTALIIIRDVTPQFRAEQEILSYHRLLDAIRRVQQNFIEAPHSRKVFVLLLEEMLSLTASEFGFVCQVQYTPEGTPYLKSLALSNIAWDEESQRLYEENVEPGLEFHNLNMLAGQVYLTNDIVISNDPASDPRRGGVPPGHPPLHSFLGIPLRYSGRTIGVAGVANRPGGYTHEHAEHLQPFFISCGTIVAAHQSRRQHEDVEYRLQVQQAQLAHASRLTTMGEMVAEIAHELAQPLAAISNFAEASQMLLATNPNPPSGRIRDWLLRIEQQTKRGGEIIERLRQYVRRGEPSRQPCDLPQIAEEAVQLVRVDARRHRATVSLESEQGLRVLADRVQIQQVLVNLILNAFEAMDAVAGSRRQAVVLVRPRGSAVEVAVEDDGCGLPPGQAEAVFEPFFTTKSVGMGLGLSICRSIVEAHGGRLWVTPNASCGVTFRFTLPLIQ